MKTFTQQLLATTKAAALWPTLQIDSWPITLSRKHLLWPTVLKHRLEDAERKYMDIIDNEKQAYKKKEQASREIIQELSRKLKQ